MQNCMRKFIFSYCFTQKSLNSIGNNWLIFKYITIFLEEINLKLDEHLTFSLDSLIINC